MMPEGESPLLLPANQHKQLVVIDFEYANANVPGLEFANHFVRHTFINPSFTRIACARCANVYRPSGAITIMTPTTRGHVPVTTTQPLRNSTGSSEHTSCTLLA